MVLDPGGDIGGRQQGLGPVTHANGRIAFRVGALFYEVWPQAITSSGFQNYGVTRNNALTTIAQLGRDMGVNDDIARRWVAAAFSNAPTESSDGGLNGMNEDPFVDGVDDSMFDIPGDIDVPLEGTIAETAAGGAVVALSLIVARAPFLRPIIMGAAQRVGVVAGGIFRWGSIPGWLKNILTGLGLAEGLDILMDSVDDVPGLDIGPFSFGGSGGDPVGNMVNAMTVSTWNANGVTFHRLSDGRLAVRNKHGVWKVWRPKKPIVIFASGQTDLKDLLRADNAIDKQAKKMAKTLRRRGWKVARS